MKGRFFFYSTCLCLLLMLHIPGSIAAGEPDKNGFHINEYGELTDYSGKEKTVIVPNHVKTIRYKAFADCDYVTKVVIPEGVTEIQNQAFLNCTKLSIVELPSTLAELSGGAFDGCTSLKELSIPKGVSDMNWRWFTYNNGLEKVHISKDNPAYCSIDGIVFSKDKKSLLVYPVNRKDETYTIPDHVIDIMNANFDSSKYLKHIVLGKNVLGAEEGYGVSNISGGMIESITVPSQNKSFSSIDGVLFSKDKKTLLAYPIKRPGEIYVIPKGTTKINSWCFGREEDEVMNLKYIFFPSGVKEIGGGTGFIGYFDGLGPNLDLTFFGKKGSVVETYCKESFDMNFCPYDPDSKGIQTLLEKTNIELGLKESVKLKALVMPQNSKAVVTWKSSNKNIAKVDSTGKITAVGLGKATITATARGGSSASCVVNVRLAAPKNVRAKVGESKRDSIIVSWDKVEQATSYQIGLYDYNTYTDLGPTNKTEFVIENIDLDKFYNIKVKALYAKNKNYDSNYSKEIYMIIPKAPSEVKAAADKGEVSLSWNKSERYFITGYTVYRSDKPNGTYKKIATVAGRENNIYLDTGLESGKTYYYKICAYETVSDVDISGQYSEAVKVKVK